jgi:HAD superfamily hydrolase (TIGR01509 family)
VKELQWIRVSDAEFAFWQKYGEQVGKALPPHWREDYQAVKMAAVREEPGMSELLNELRGAGYSLAILSNFEPWMEPLLERFGYRSQFDHLYLSYQTHIEKPSAQAYQAMLDDLGLREQEILFIDDQVRNVRAAEKLGIDAIPFVSVSDLRKELVERGIFEGKL